MVELSQQFDILEKGKIDSGRREAFHELLDELNRNYFFGNQP